MIDPTSSLLEKMAQGDTDALTALYKTTGPKLFGVCMRLLGNEADAEDALQDIYLKVWHKAGQYDLAYDKPLAWLCTIARYHCLDILRTRKAKSDKHAPLEDVQIADTTCIEAGLEGKQMGAKLTHCLSILEPPRGDAVHRAYVEGYSYQDLSDMFNVPLNTMRTWLRRGLISLKSCMQETVKA